VDKEVKKGIKLDAKKDVKKNWTIIVE
jgi:hypothetical protein